MKIHKLIVLPVLFFALTTVALAASIHAWGDSITVGIGASVPAETGYAAIVGENYDPFENNGENSTQIVQHSVYAVTNAVVDDTYTSFILSGYNDMRALGTDTTNLDSYKEMLYGYAAWLAVPNAEKVYGQDASVVFTGTWSNASVYGGDKLKWTNENGATATVTVEGDTVIVGATDITSSNGTFDIHIDDVYKGTFNVNRPYSAHKAGAPAYSPTAHVFSGLGLGSHSVKMTAKGGGNVYLDWVAGNDWASTGDKPLVLVGNCLYMNSAGYSIGGGTWGNGSDAAVDAVNTRINDVVNTLSAANLDVRLVDANAVYDPDTADVDSDNIHPSDQGHQKIAGAFLEELGVGETNPPQQEEVDIWWDSLTLTTKEKVKALWDAVSVLFE